MARNILNVGRSGVAITGIDIGNSTDNPLITLNGPTRLTGQAIGTGANTPTLGTNKPGSAGDLTPQTWLTLRVNGTDYYVPLWI